MCPDRAGDTRKDAKKLKVSEKSTTFKDAIGGKDDNDFFRVKFKHSTSLDVSLSGLKAKTRLELQNKKGKAIEQVKSKGKKASLSLTVEDGTYFLRVFPKNQQDKTKYTLKATGNRDRAGETLDLARDISLSATPQDFTDFVGVADKIDLYEFTLTDSATVDLSLTNLKKDANLFLLDADGAVIRSSTGSGKTAEAIEETLAAGTYYAKVSTKLKKKGTTYTLTGSAIVEDDEPPVIVPQEFVQEWITQFGTSGNDYSYDVITDASGNIYLVGSTEGDLEGTNAGSADAFLGLYTNSGSIQSIQQLGSANLDVFSGVALDSQNNIYTAGARNVAAPNLTIFFPGSGDALLAKYSVDGGDLAEQDQQTFGDGIINAAADVAIDTDDNVYIAGSSLSLSGLSIVSDAFVTKYNSAGEEQALTGDIANITDSGAVTGIAVDAAGNIYVAGVTNATINADPSDPYTDGDAFVAKYSSSGDELWFETLGTAATDTARRLAIDSAGNVYVVGLTEGALAGNALVGDKDAFVAKYSTDGEQQWVNQFGTTSLDEAQSVAIDSAGNVYVTGETEGSLFGTSFGGSDAWVVKYNDEGQTIASLQIGGAADEETYGITVDNAGKVYLVGQTTGDLGGTNQGSFDVWLAQYSLEG